MSVFLYRYADTIRSFRCKIPAGWNAGIEVAFNGSVVNRVLFELQSYPMLTRVDVLGSLLEVMGIRLWRRSA